MSGVGRMTTLPGGDEAAVKSALPQVEAWTRRLVPEAMARQGADPDEIDFVLAAMDAGPDSSPLSVKATRSGTRPGQGRGSDLSDWTLEWRIIETGMPLRGLVRLRVDPGGMLDVGRLGRALVAWARRERENAARRDRRARNAAAWTAAGRPGGDAADATVAPSTVDEGACTVSFRGVHVRMDAAVVRIECIAVVLASLRSADEGLVRLEKAARPA